MGEIVKTAQGDVRGAVVDGVYRYLGVPFAAPPVGANRMRPPQPVEPWNGVREALEYGPAPPQVAPPESAGPGWDTDAGGDDCLTLNIWTPDPGASGLPVMMWIQGGAFVFGSTAAYDGSHFARDGVVCVVINWRLGADGFLYLGEGTGNLGLLDQVAALEWVRENIAAFGGDPGNVTVFGESAGAMSVGTLLSMPRAEGLFHRAIPQSGAAHAALSAETAFGIGRRLAAKLGVPPTREAVAAVPVERLLRAQAEVQADFFAQPDPSSWGADLIPSLMLWQPVVDGAVVPAFPLERIAAGEGARVDLMVGTNTDDWKLFLAITGALAQVTDDDLSGPFKIGVAGTQSLAGFGLPMDRALAEYRARYPGASPGDVLAAVQTDWWVRIPAIRLADAHVAAGRRTYMYEFAWAATGLGAVHGLEIPFVFDTVGLDSTLFGSMLTENPPQELAKTMHAAWVDFASKGDPGWPAYDLVRRATMRFDTVSQVVDDPRAWERALWEGVR